MYKVGDIVKLLNHPYVNIKPYGKIVEIRKDSEDNKFLIEISRADSTNYNYNLNFNEEQISPIKYKIGDRVNISTDFYEGIESEGTIIDISWERCEIIYIIKLKHYPQGLSFCESEILSIKDTVFTIGGQHFGSERIYNWKCDPILFDEISIGDLIEVDTLLGTQIVLVVSKNEVMTSKTKAHREVLKILSKL